MSMGGTEFQGFCVKIVIFNLFNMFSELRPCRGFSEGGRVTKKPGVAGPTKLYLSCAHTYGVLDHTLRNNRGNKDTLNTLNPTGPMTGLDSDEIYGLIKQTRGPLNRPKKDKKKLLSLYKIAPFCFSRCYCVRNFMLDLSLFDELCDELCFS